jgi:hypothetical protein
VLLVAVFAKFGHHGRYGNDRRQDISPEVVVTLDSDDIDAIAERAARRVVQLLERQSPGVYELLEPKDLARALNVSLDYVYAHSADLGAMRLGYGPKARLRFDLRTAQRAMKAHDLPRSQITARQ